MAKKQVSPQHSQSFTPNGRVEAGPPDVANVFREVGRLLQEGQPATALERLTRSGIRSAQVMNAQAVCQLRMGYAESAVDTLRPLVLADVGVALREEAPAVFKTNYATAHLVAGNVALGLDALAAVPDEDHPAARRLREAVRRWRAGLTFWQKLDWWMGGKPDRPVTLDFPPGDLE